MLGPRLITAAALLVAASASSCIDPAHTDAVAALGPEAAGVREGETHRPGQPCLTCHGGDGPGSPQFVVAGTVFAVREGTEPLRGVKVVVTDASNRVKELETNKVGNFYLEAERWSPTFPLFVRLEYGSEKKEMLTRIGGNGGCGFCHQGAGDSSRMPGVFLRDK